MIIFLNGPSSSGKTSIARCLQDKYPTPLVHIGTFTFMDLIHSNFKGIKNRKTSLGFYFSPKVVNGKKVYQLGRGQYGRKLLKSAFDFIKILAKDNNNLIIEEVISTRKELVNYLSIFKDQQVYFVGVKCPLKIIEERERERGNRIRGQARSVFSKVHPKNRRYDIEINTSKYNPDQCAEIILNFITKNTKASAWNLLYEKTT